MNKGTVKWYNDYSGYGFIQPAGGGKDVFVHATALERSGIRRLSEGQRVHLRTADRPAQRQDYRGKPETRSVTPRNHIRRARHTAEQALAACIASGSFFAFETFRRDHFCSWFSRSQRQRQRFSAGNIRFGTLLFELASLHDVVHSLRDISGVVTHALNVLGARLDVNKSDTK